MSRIFVDAPLTEQSRIELENEAHHYIKHVLRMRAGDPLFLFNGTEKEYAAKIAAIQKNKTVIQILEAKTSHKESPIHIIIGQAVPKGQKMDNMIPRITELGAFALVPLITQRSDLKKVSPQKLKRWQKIATQSAQQTGRSTVPKIFSPVTLTDFLEENQHHEKILFYELASAENFKTAVENSKTDALYLIIGPEGGFSPEEISQAQQAGCRIVSLGKRILKTETVAPAVTAIIQYVKGDLNRL